MKREPRRTDFMSRIRAWHLQQFIAWWNRREREVREFFAPRW